MKKKSIVVPKNTKAEIDLDFNNAKDEQLIQLFLTELEFKLLQDSNFFNIINDIVDVNIDDYEDERITDIEKLKILVESSIFNNNIYGNDILFIVSSIKKIFLEAISRKTGVYFFF